VASLGPTFGAPWYRHFLKHSLKQNKIKYEVGKKKIQGTGLGCLITITVALEDSFGLNGKPPSDNKYTGTKRHILEVGQHPLSFSIASTSYSAIGE
jgi:hypothetical protein